MADDTIVVLDQGARLSFCFEDLLRYSGPHSPAGVALAFQAMRLSFAVLESRGPLQRREVEVRTPFRGRALGTGSRW